MCCDAHTHTLSQLEWHGAIWIIGMSTLIWASYRGACSVSLLYGRVRWTYNAPHDTMCSSASTGDRIPHLRVVEQALTGSSARGPLQRVDIHTYCLSVIPIAASEHLVVFVLVPGALFDAQPARCKRRLRTSSKLLTANPCVFITGLTCAARARRSLRASPSSSGVDLRGVMKLMCGFGFASTSFSLTCTIAKVSFQRFQVSYYPNYR